MNVQSPLLSPQNFTTLTLTVWERLCFEDIIQQTISCSVNELVTKLFVGQPRLHRVCQLFILQI